MKIFREESDDVASGAVYCSSTKTWIAGGTVGLLYTLNEQQGEDFQSEETNEDNNIVALCLSNDQRALAIAFGDKVTLQQYPNFKEPLDTDAPPLRRILSISQLAFTKSNGHL